MWFWIVVIVLALAVAGLAVVRAESRTPGLLILGLAVVSAIAVEILIRSGAVSVGTGADLMAAAVMLLAIGGVWWAASRSSER